MILNKDRYVIITGGGTGGHLSVAKTLVDEFFNRGWKVIFVGSTKGADKSWFENDKNLFLSLFLDTYGVVNQSKLGKIKSLFKIIKGMFKVIKLIKKYNVEKIVSVGGFSAASASFAAILTKRDFYIHEQNAYMGKLNKITSKFAKEVFSSYSKDSKVKDYPIKDIYFDNARLREDIKTIIFLGGSQGAVAINDFAIKVAPKLHSMGIKIIHQAGKNDFDRISKEYQKLGIMVDCFDFSKELISKMNQADFAISRSGASTLWELCALGIPSLFIPFPYAAGDHQYFNAKFIEDKKLGYVIRESKLKEENLFKIIEEKEIEEKSRSLINLISKDGVVKIVDTIIKG